MPNFLFIDMYEERLEKGTYIPDSTVLLEEAFELPGPSA